jgi:membrane-associated protein
MSVFRFFFDLLQDPRSFIAGWIEQFGSIWVYAPLALIIFVETGVVFMPFLPGDSVLFAAGVFSAPGGGLNVIVLICVCVLAAFLGDVSNYWIGRKLGMLLISSGKVKALTPERMEKTQSLLDRYGALAVFLARFFPFIRTFTPFMAGFGTMHFGRFMMFNAIGGVVWVSLFTLLGHFFGGLPFVQEHFELIVLMIIVISVIPALVGAIRTGLNTRLANRG